MRWTDSGGIDAACVRRHAGDGGDAVRDAGDSRARAVRRRAHRDCDDGDGAAPGLLPSSDGDDVLRP